MLKHFPIHVAQFIEILKAERQESRGLPNFRRATRHDNFYESYNIFKANMFQMKLHPSFSTEVLKMDEVSS